MGRREEAERGESRGLGGWRRVKGGREEEVKEGEREGGSAG